MRLSQAPPGAVCAAVVIPVAIFIAVQSVRFHRRAYELSGLDPGVTREEVVSRVGTPTSQSSIGEHTYWHYVAALPEPIRLSFLLQDGVVLFFSPEGRVLSKHVLPAD